ncbi:hypothetical protein DN387_14205 [Pseudomonas sp. FBF18]|uniref:hypothetical protein n=1 Tax=Pseudomonas TaxID=286 RepID=UPI001F4447A8|nr:MULTISPECIES: hypothetical protein [Pseudomonas]MCP8349392.1 hypothetical protein [Pseudomonas sp. FBF18]
MPALAKPFREQNHDRIAELDESGMSPREIAKVIREETSNEFPISSADVRGYLMIQQNASKRMLITKTKLEALLVPQTA